MTRFRATLVCLILGSALTVALSGCGGGTSTPPWTLTVGNVNGTAGALIQEWVTLNNVSSVAGYHFVLTYNAANLNLIQVAPGPDVPTSSTFTINPSPAGTIDVTVTGTTQFINSPSGRVLNMRFEFASPSPMGTVNPVTWLSATLTDVLSLPIPITTVSGGITTV
jgi:hypothetical protein